MREAQRFGIVPHDLPPQSDRRVLARPPRSAPMPPTGRSPLREERLFPLALMFRQSCEDFVRPLPLRRVGQIIRKTFLEKLDDIVLWPCAFNLPRQVGPQFVDQPPLILRGE